MCIVIFKPKGTKCTEELIDAIITSGIRNSDGMGVAIKRDGKKTILLKKGLYKPESFGNFVRKLEIQDDDEMLFHARIRTHGATSDQNCHPYIISPTEAIIDNTSDESIKLPVLAHNGMMYDCYETGSVHSDTYLFVKNFASLPGFMAMMKECGNIKTPKSKIQNIVFGFNKICIMFPDKEAILIGNFQIDLDGCYFSNSSYKNFNKPVLLPEIIDDNVPYGDGYASY